MLPVLREQERVPLPPFFPYFTLLFEYHKKGLLSELLKRPSLPFFLYHSKSWLSCPLNPCQIGYGDYQF